MSQSLDASASVNANTMEIDITFITGVESRVSGFSLTLSVISSASTHSPKAPYKPAFPTDSRHSLGIKLLLATAIIVPLSIIALYDLGEFSTLSST